MMKRCYRCKKTLDDNANFCSHCGANLKRKRYEVVKFENIYLDDVAKWIQNFNYEILSIKGDIRFENRGIIGGVKYYFTYISIRYYPNTSGHRYRLVHANYFDSIFIGGEQHAINDIVKQKRNFPPIKDPVFDYIKTSIFTDSSKIYCGVCIYEY